MLTGDASEFFVLADRMARVPAVVDRAITAATATWGKTTEAAARAYAPELTGELRDGIHARVDGKSATVVSEAPHSLFVEEGTSDTAPQPFMQPAFDQTTPVFESAFEKAPDGLL